MNQLQKQLDQFIYHWQPGESVNFNIDLEHSMADILEVEKADEDGDNVILNRDDSYDGNLSAWFELNEIALINQYHERTAEWKREKEMNDEFYGRRAI